MNSQQCSISFISPPTDKMSRTSVLYLIFECNNFRVDTIKQFLDHFFTLYSCWPKQNFHGLMYYILQILVISTKTTFASLIYPAIIAICMYTYASLLQNILTSCHMVPICTNKIISLQIYRQSCLLKAILYYHID